MRAIVAPFADPPSRSSPPRHVFSQATHNRSLGNAVSQRTGRIRRRRARDRRHGRRAIGQARRGKHDSLSGEQPAQC